MQRLHLLLYVDRCLSDYFSRALYQKCKHSAPPLVLPPPAAPGMCRRSSPSPPSPLTGPGTSTKRPPPNLPLPRATKSHMRPGTSSKLPPPRCRCKFQPVLPTKAPNTLDHNNAAAIIQKLDRSKTNASVCEFLVVPHFKGHASAAAVQSGVIPTIFLDPF